ncbi:class I SAM-dependent methyltransferase [Lysinibacter cavernae]|uniref:SAM-dependent methyltransferase n=1 Tax=Lysinibacter cavernae TaxID=1640652 RepID=A0A7X5QY63_9MICO|nr:class I SAM-dependent methyltransferase [Lysinibacter cavernae]NIH52154.1 SAM-dependent methyltransferase [Lysinibacter cavernae]
MNDSFSLNRANWDERAPIHAASEAYSVNRFVEDQSFISDVVRFDLPLLGEITGLTGIHLQCHIGTDTVSLARLGATMTGLDFSPASLAEGKALAAAVDLDIRFIESNVYDAPAAVDGRTFDLVYTGIGAICWLPSIERWASTVAALLSPGGRLFIREGHPMLWAIDDERDDAIVVTHPYFETAEPLVWDDDSTYVETTEVITSTVSHEWNHGIGELMTALLGQGLTITSFVEHQSVPWDALPGQLTEVEHGEYVLTDRPERLPLTYTLTATKPL